MKKKRVLLVEDDYTLEPFWRMISQKLEGQPEFEWVTSESAAERAISKGHSKGWSYDVIICDIFLSGGKTGIDLWRKCRGEATEFVFTSGISIDKFERVLSGSTGHHPFLMKPLDPLACVSTINTLLKAGSGAIEAA